MSGETILVVDDELMVLRLLGEVLRMEGYAVLEAGSGREALVLYEQHEDTIRLLLTDVQMPAMNGVELGQQVVARRPDMKVIYVSGFAASPLVQLVIQDSGRAFLAKPIPMDDLVRKVRELLDEERAP